MIDLYSVQVSRMGFGWSFDIWAGSSQLDTGEDFKTWREAWQAAADSVEYYEQHPSTPRLRSKEKKVQAYNASNGLCLCLRCGYRWSARQRVGFARWYSTSEPKRCASCRSPLWNVPRKNRPAGSEKVSGSKLLTTAGGGGR